MKFFFGIGAVAIVLSFIAAVATLFAKMFEFCLDVWFAKDAPWYVDLFFGCLLSEILVPLWALTYFLSFTVDSLPIIQ